MENPNLLLRFTRAHGAEIQVRAASRIRVDGLGGLLVYEDENAEPERLCLAELEYLSIDRATTSSARRWVN